MFSLLPLALSLAPQPAAAGPYSVPPSLGSCYKQSIQQNVQFMYEHTPWILTTLEEQYAEHGNPFVELALDDAAALEEEAALALELANEFQYSLDYSKNSSKARALLSQIKVAEQVANDTLYFNLVFACAFGTPETCWALDLVDEFAYVADVVQNDLEEDCI